VSQSLKERLKQWIFKLQGKDPDAVVNRNPITAIAAMTPLAARAALWFSRSVK
jgi:hypothetical protein